jgi:hypothetical protein
VVIADKMICVFLTGEEYTFWMARCDGKGPLEVLGVDGRIILKWNFKKLFGETWIGLLSLGIRTVGGLL